MARSNGRMLLVVGILLVAGCSGSIPADEQPTVETQKLRIVVQSDASSPETITLTLSAADGDTVLNETKTVEPEGGWVVTTLVVSAVETPVTITAQMPARNYTEELTPVRSTDRGSRLLTISDEGINIHECNTNVTCWQQKPDT